MNRKTAILSCDRGTACQLATAIRAYTEAAYPKGGSDCSQVARNALLDAAAHFGLHNGGELALRRRQLALLRACVRWYFGEDGPADAASGSKLMEMLQRRQ